MDDTLIEILIVTIGTRSVNQVIWTNDYPTGLSTDSPTNWSMHPVRIIWFINSTCQLSSDLAIYVALFAHKTEIKFD